MFSAILFSVAVIRAVLFCISTIMRKLIRSLDPKEDGDWDELNWLNATMKTYYYMLSFLMLYPATADFCSATHCRCSKSRLVPSARETTSTCRAGNASRSLLLNLQECSCTFTKGRNIKTEWKLQSRLSALLCQRHQLCQGSYMYRLERCCGSSEIRAWHLSTARYPERTPLIRPANNWGKGEEK